MRDATKRVGMPACFAIPNGGGSATLIIWQPHPSRDRRNDDPVFGSRAELLQKLMMSGGLGDFTRGSSAGAAARTVEDVEVDAEDVYQQRGRWRMSGSMRRMCIRTELTPMSHDHPWWWYWRRRFFWLWCQEDGVCPCCRRSRETSFFDVAVATFATFAPLCCS